MGQNKASLSEPYPAPSLKSLRKFNPVQRQHGRGNGRARSTPGQILLIFRDQFLVAGIRGVALAFRMSKLVFGHIHDKP